MQDILFHGSAIALQSIAGAFLGRWAALKLQNQSEQRDNDG